MAYKVLDELHERGMVGLADKLPWRLPLEDGICLTNGGGFMVTYEYVGPNPDGVSENDVLTIANDVNEAIMDLGGGWTWNFRLRKRRNDHFPAANPNAPPCAQIHHAERQAFTQRGGVHFRTSLYISLSYSAPRDASAAANRYFFEPRNTDDTVDPANEVVEQFKNASEVKTAFLAGLTIFENRFLSQLHLRRLELYAELVDGAPQVYDEHATFLYSTIRGTWQNIVPPPSGMTYGKMFAAHEVVMDWQPRIDDDAIVVLNVTRPPRSSLLGHLRVLEYLPMDLDVNLRCVVMSRPAARKHAERKGDEWQASARGFVTEFVAKASGGLAKVNKRSLQLGADADKLVNRIDNSEVTLVQPTFSLVFFNSDRKKALDDAGTARDTLRNIGYISFIARAEAARSYLATLPGEAYSRVSQHCWTSANVALSVPLTSTWSGPMHHPSSFYDPADPAGHIIATTTGGTLCVLPLHWNTAGHTIVVGAQRSGKSVLLKRLALAHMQMRNARLFALDRDESMHTLAALFNDEGVGVYYNLGADDAAICPAEFIGETGDRGEREREYLLGFVEQLLTLQDVKRTKERRAELAAGILRMSKSDMRRLSELAMFVSDAEIWRVLEYYTNPLTLVGRLLNGAANAIPDRRVVIVETNCLDNLGPNDTTPIYRQLLHLMDRMSRDSGPMQAMFDECSLYLRDTYLANYLFEVLRRWGKRNVHAIFATQGVIDIQNAGDAGAALEQECKTKIFCGDTSAADPGQMNRLMSFARLSTVECTTIARNAESRGYYYTSPLGRATFWLGIQPVEAAMSTCDEGEQLQAVKALRAAHPTDWFIRHLRARGLNDWASYYAQLRANTNTSPTSRHKEAA